MSRGTAMPLDPTLSVNQLLLRHPAALPILTAAGIDTCCGGGLTLAKAAQDSGLTFDQLAARLEQGLSQDRPDEPAPPSCGCGCKAD